MYCYNYSTPHYVFSEPFGNKLKVCLLFLKYFHVYLLRTRIFSYLTIV